MAISFGDPGLDPKPNGIEFKLPKQGSIVNDMVS